jgi:hypothetical protein
MGIYQEIFSLMGRVEAIVADILQLAATAPVMAEIETA